MKSLKIHKTFIFMQSLPRNTDTGVTLSLLGLNSIELEIDYRKWCFGVSCAACLATVL